MTRDRRVERLTDPAPRPEDPDETQSPHPGLSVAEVEREIRERRLAEQGGDQ